MIDRQAVMQAVLGASASVAALLLVLQGFLLSARSRLAITDDPKVKGRYRASIIGIIAVVGLSVLVALGATAWLVGLELFWPTVAGFVLSLVLLLVASALVTVLALE